jgi:hypothetical protein
MPSTECKVLALYTVFISACTFMMTTQWGLGWPSNLDGLSELHLIDLTGLDEDEDLHIL